MIYFKSILVICITLVLQTITVINFVNKFQTNFSDFVHIV